MKYEGLKCDRCEAFEAKEREVDLFDDPKNISEDHCDQHTIVKADLCDTCWSGVERAVRRAMSKPVARKGGADGTR